MKKSYPMLMSGPLFWSATFFLMLFCTASIKAATLIVDPPVAVCQNITVQLDAMGNATITPGQIDGGSTDDVGIASLSIDIDTFSCADIGTASVILTVEDVEGLTATCTALVTVEDSVAPAILCPANIVVSTDSGTCDAVVNYGVSATDNCGATGTITDTFIYTGAIENWTVPAGVTSVTIEAFGAEGGGPVGTATFGFATPGKGARMKGDFTVTPGDVLNILVGEQGFNNTASSSGGGGSFVVTSGNNPLLVAGGGGGAWVTGFDARMGNGGDGLIGTSGGDNTGPNAVMGGDNGNGGNALIGGAGGGFLTDGASGSNGLGGMAFLNGGAGGGAGSGGQAGGFGGGGSHTNNGCCVAGGGGGYSGGAGGGRFVAPDLTSGGGGSFNSGTNQSNTGGVREGNGIVTITYDVVSNPVNQTAGLPSGSTFPIGVTTNTFETSDASGNTVMCSFTVTVEDNEAPAFTFCQPNITITNIPNCEAVVTWTEPTATDNCSAVTFSQTHTSGDTFQLGVTVVTYTATDAAGNESTCTFFVSLIDIEDPVISDCPTDINMNTAGCDAIVNWAAPTAMDNCSIASFTSTHNPGDTFPLGSTQVIYTAVDTAGRSVICTFNVVVAETEAPVFTSCPSNIDVDTDPNECDAIVSWTVPVFTDNCGATLSSTHNPGDTFPIGVTTVTYTATDISGNFTECSFNVTVTNINVVSFDCPANIMVNNDVTSCGAVVNFAPPQLLGDCTPLVPVAQTFSYTGAIENWTVPAGITSITIEAFGAEGGGPTGAAIPGKGARMKGDFTVTPGDILQILVGQQGLNNTVSSTGGGGSFIVTDTNTPLLIAGGGGGAWVTGFDSRMGNGGDGLVGTSGGDNTGPNGVMGGDNGNGGSALIGGAGGGFLTNGANGGNGLGGMAFLNGGAGGSGGSSGGQAGGFGGGGSHTNNGCCVAGGGGGYSGGAGGGRFVAPDLTSGGGGSFNTGTNQSNTGGVRQGNGEVTITYFVSSAVITQTAGLASGSEFPVGTTTNTFEVSYAGGLTDTCSFDVTVMDAEAPVVMCPGSQTEIAGAGCRFQIPDYISLATITDNCNATPTVTQSPAAGTMVPAGVTVVTITADDGINPVTSCSFDITVQGAVTEYTMAGTWTNGVPDMTKSAVISGIYNTQDMSNGSIDACDCTITTGGELNIGDGDYLNVIGNIDVSGDLMVAHQGSVVQQDALAITINNGTIEVDVTTPLLAPREFILSGSPMSAETRDGVWDAAFGVFEHNTANFVPNAAVTAAFPLAENFSDDNGDDYSPLTGAITPTEGYLVRPQASITDGNATYDHTYTQGTLNSGDLLYPVLFNTDKNSSYNLLANPYASAISADDFINANTMVDEVYFWERGTAPSSSFPGAYNVNFSMEDISMYNLIGGVAAASDPSGMDTAPNGTIATSQGFSIKANTAGNALFANAMRRTTGNTTLRSGIQEDSDRVWLQIASNEYEVQGSMLIGFTNNASQGYDPGYDSKRLANAVSIFSHLPDITMELAIQSREVFDSSIEIPLGFSTQVDILTSYTISLQNIEGVLIEGATVYLLDKETGVKTNLSETGYEFEAVKGQYSNRFVLSFADNELGVDGTLLETITVYPNPANDYIIIANPNRLLLDQLMIVDVSGRVVYDHKKKEGNEQTRIALETLSSGNYFVKITSQNKVTVKKLIVE